MDRVTRTTPNGVLELLEKSPAVATVTPIIDKKMPPSLYFVNPSDSIKWPKNIIKTGKRP